MTIRRTLLDDGTIRIESELRVEIHDAAGTIVEGRDATPTDAASVRAWATGRERGLSERLAPTAAAKPAGRHVL